MNTMTRMKKKRRGDLKNIINVDVENNVDNVEPREAEECQEDAGRRPRSDMIGDSLERDFCPSNDPTWENLKDIEEKIKFLVANKADVEKQ